MKTSICITLFKWRIVSLLIMCLSVFLPVVAQTDSTRWTVSQGQWRVLIHLNAYDIARSYLPNIKTTDVSSLGILNIGSGFEMAYRDNRTLRLMAHVGIIGNNQFSFAETYPPYPSTRIVIENGRKKLQSDMRMLHDEGVQVHRYFLKRIDASSFS